MPTNKKLDAALELLKSDPTKLLGLTVGEHTITEPGHFVPRAGKAHHTNSPCVMLTH